MNNTTYSVKKDKIETKQSFTEPPARSCNCYQL